MPLKTKYTSEFLFVIRNLKKMLQLGIETDKKLFIGFYLTALLGALTPLVASLSLKFVLDELIGAKGSYSIPLIIIVILGARYILIFLGNLTLWGLNRTYFDSLFSLKLVHRINSLFYTKMANLDIAQLENPTIQNNIGRIRDAMTWRLPEFLRFFSFFFGNFVMYTSALIVLAPYGFWLPIVVTMATFPRLYVRLRFGNFRWQSLTKGSSALRRHWYLTTLLSSETAIRETRIFGSSTTLLNKLSEIQNSIFLLNKKPLDRHLKELAFSPLFETIALFGIVVFFIPKALSGAITIGSFTLILSLIDQLSGSASGAVINFGDMHEHSLYVRDYFQILDLKPQIKIKKRAVGLGKISSPKIEFRNVWFRYPRTRKWILRNISFTLMPMENIAIVGGNGAGKSTIIKLICRFYDVTKGSILINDVDIKNIKLSDWYRFMSTLFQDFVHYHLTVKENILLGNTNVYDTKLMKKASHLAGANYFIENLPNKYDQLLGKEYEGGIELSGGQWQKLAIARAFYQQAPLLILDEPTSAIDAEAEFEIFNNMENAYRERSLILVSHRFSTVRNADRILVIENQEVAEEGTHQELMRLNGRYATMFRLQAKGYQ